MSGRPAWRAGDLDIWDDAGQEPRPWEVGLGQGGPLLELAPQILCPRNSPSSLFLGDVILSASLAPVPGDPSRAQPGVSTGISDNMYGIEFNPQSPLLSQLLLDCDLFTTLHQ